ncbi:MAG: hypothetical protein A2Z59_04060 [Nitrospinae bacterium RIFCSPLOWO2_02_39_17]|nr:MAG: hypothetical protein A2Z59_04060 [Nitrospinae bacterium RIFCSPLOWO2_02_39_17]
MKPTTQNKDQIQDIEKVKQEHPEIAEALEIFDIGMKEYAEAFRFLNEPEIITTNNSNELISTS